MERKATAIQLSFLFVRMVQRLATALKCGKKCFVNIFRSLQLKIVEPIINKCRKERKRYEVRQWRKRRSSVNPITVPSTTTRKLRNVQKKLMSKSSKTNKNIEKTNKNIEKTNKKIEKKYDIMLGIFEQMGIEFVYKSNKYRKFTWYVIVFTMMVLLLVQCVDAVNRYFDWDVNTQITYETVRDLKYPSVTFCNMNSLRRSVVGSNLLIHTAMAFLIADSAEGKQTEMALNSSKLCKQENETEMDLRALMQTALEMKKISDFNKYVRIGGVDSFVSVEKCWWNNKEFECKGAFQNQLFDTRLCFTYNPNDAINTFEDGNDAVGYGFDAKANDHQQSVFNSWPKQGLRILLNTHQEEYCGSYSKWFGAGFYVFIHDYQRPQSVLNHAPLGLTPGYHTQITLKPRSFDRQTEFLGRCKSQMDLFLLPLKEKIYCEETCLAQCLSAMTWKVCKCFPTQVESMKKLAAKHYRLPLEKINTCNSLEQLECIKNLMSKAQLKLNTNKFCQCKPACSETVYDYTTSTLSFPSKQLFENFNRYNSTLDYKTFKKNYVLATINFDSMNVEQITETQMFTIADLLTYIGGSFGLFLGWSVASNAGLCLHLILQLATVFVNRLKKKNASNDNLRKNSYFRRQSITKRRPTLAELYL